LGSYKIFDYDALLLLVCFPSLVATNQNLAQPLVPCVRMLSLVWSSKVPLVAVSITYLSLVRLLRWRRYNKVHDTYKGRNIESLTPQDAQNIILPAYLYDMPGLLDYAVSFALFKTYSIVGFFILRLFHK